VADESVARPLIVTPFQMFRDDTVRSADPADIVVPWTVREF
jgi:hypothetical protein